MMKLKFLNHTYSCSPSKDQLVMVRRAAGDNWKIYEPHSQRFDKTN